MRETKENLELLKERIERQLKKVDFRLKSGSVKTSEDIKHLEGKKEGLEIALLEIKWEITKITLENK